MQREIKFSNATQKFRHTPKGVLTNIYSKMKYRNKINGFGALPFSLKEFQAMFLDNEKFNRLFEEWESRGFIKSDKPSIDRINNKKGYGFPNIQIIKWSENRYKQNMERRSRKGKVLQLLGDKIINVFSSQKEASNKLGYTQSVISNALSGKNKTAYGYKWKYLNSNPELLEGKCQK